jgi:hypothetical protein
MTEDLGNSNGLQIETHEKNPTAKVHMFINGQHTHWVEFNVPQMSGLIKVFQRELKKMKKREIQENKDD